MIAYTTLLLGIIGILSSIKVEIKADKMLSVLTFISLSFVFWYFCNNLISGQEDVFSFIWNSTPGRVVKVDIISSPYNYGLIFPFFVMTLVSAGFNTMYRFEERRSTYNAMLAFNLAALMTMISSNNFVPLLFALFVVDILALFLVRDISACRRYILLNMLADMILFTVLAVINSQVSSLDLREILIYRKIGKHLDFIAVGGLTAIFMKLGFFLFHIGTSELKDVRLHRLINILFLSSPAAALILLLKFHLLWSGSAYFADYTNVVCAASALWGFGGLLTIDDFKSKVMYLLVMFWALFVEVLRFNGFIWQQVFTCLLLEMYVMAQAMFLIFYATNRKKCVSQMMKMFFANKKDVVLPCFFIVLMIGALANTLQQLFDLRTGVYIILFAVFVMLSLSAVIRQIYFAEKKIPEGSAPTIEFKLLPPLLLLAISVGVLWDVDIKAVEVWGSMVLFCVLCLYSPLSRSAKFYQWQGLQNADVIGMIYDNLLLAPLRFGGRFLWLLVDWVFIEKVIVGAVSGGVQGSIRFFRQLHTSRFWGPASIVIVTAALLWFSFEWGRLR